MSVYSDFRHRMRDAFARHVLSFAHRGDRSATECATATRVFVPHPSCPQIHAQNNPSGSRSSETPRLPPHAICNGWRTNNDSLVHADISHHNRKTHHNSTTKSTMGSNTAPPYLALEAAWPVLPYQLSQREMRQDRSGPQQGSHMPLCTTCGRLVTRVVYEAVDHNGDQLQTGMPTV